MKRFLFKNQAVSLLLFLLSGVAVHAHNLSMDPFMPDEVVTKDGHRYRGLIIKNGAKKVILKEKDGERTISKKAITRITDVNKKMISFTGFVPKGELPPWQVMVQDFRDNDSIQSFYQIPSARINHGYLKNVPYLAYAVNKFCEFDIFGDPENPVCISMGAYAPVLSKKKFQKVARMFFAGYLGSRADIGTLYKLNLNGDEQHSGNFVFKVLPPTAPGSHGGWWLSIYNPARLEKARVSDEEYQKVTLPYIQIRNAIGALRPDFGHNRQKIVEEATKQWGDKMPDLHGFYRTSKNQLKLIFASHKKAAKEKAAQEKTANER